MRLTSKTPGAPLGMKRKRNYSKEKENNENVILKDFQTRVRHLVAPDRVPESQCPPAALWHSLSRATRWPPLFAAVVRQKTSTAVAVHAGRPRPSREVKPLRIVGIDCQPIRPIHAIW